MHAVLRRCVVVSLSAAAGLAAMSAVPAEAKGGFKQFFQAQLPGEPKGGKSFKVKPKITGNLAAIYNDAAGSVSLNATSIKPGLTTVSVLISVNVFAGMDLTEVTFPVSRPCLITLSYSKTKVLGGGTPYSLNYSTEQNSGVTLTVDSYDPATGNMTGTLSGSVTYHENVQDPKDDARDGTVIALKNAKFALTKPNP